MNYRTIIPIILLFLTTSVFSQDYPKFRFNLNGGMNYFLAKVDKNDTFGSQLKWGKNIEPNFYYIFSNGNGIGLKYKYLFHSAKPTDFIVDIYDGFNYAIINLSEKDYIHYFGVSYMKTIWLNSLNNLSLSSSLSAGYIMLISDFKRDFELSKTTGGNFGSELDLSLDYYLTKNISIGLNTGLFVGNIYKVKYEDRYKTENRTLTNEQRINLSNLKFNLSLSYNFY